MAKKLVKYKYQTLSLFLNSMNSAYRVSKCLACGSTNYQKLEIGQLCSNCGVVLASPERFCSLCGEKIESFSTSCLNCSANFSDNFEIKEETNEHLDAYFSKIVSDIILTAKKLEVKKYPIDFTYWHLFLASTVKWYPTLDYLLSKNASKTVFSYFGIKKVKSLEKLVDEFYKLIQKIDIENGEEDITSLIKIIPLVPILAVAVWKKLGRASSEEILLYSGDKSKSRNVRDLVCEFLEFYTVKILDTVSSFIDKKIVGSRAALLETVVNNSFSMVLITTILTQLQYKVEFIPKAVQLHASALVSFAFHLGEVADKETKPVFVSFAKNGLKTVLSFIQNFIKRKNLFIVSGSLLFYSKFLADFASKLDEDFLFEINESLLEKINEFEFEGRLIDFAQTFDIVHFILAGIWSLANTSDNFQYREKIKDLTRTLINRTVLANPRFSIDETFFPQIVELIALTSYDYEYLVVSSFYTTS
ncbi:MAG: zinc ribbon domain-containing protein [Candidatus Heimdallarchaeum endolithica]|uniref:Zinc ribbon domain-containing protein n=1 Tax=Candidatus Heimdallarchaeum endolithica TaxID=2876572 RepID=A0A9Y1BTP6_9ARCH|nr:MAG: zinc ribbon domain-containing protein [Candidatus Heimdallarchaeum endolithica]